MHITILTTLFTAVTLQPNAYNNINNTLHGSYTAVAMESTQIATKEIPVDDIIASFDGNWQKRGYASLYGVVAAVSHGKVVDSEFMSKFCLLFCY